MTSKFGYDPAGNRTSTSVSGPEGSVVSESQFNAGNQLTASSIAGSATGSAAGSSSYSYDANGNRVSQDVGGARTSFEYGVNDQLAKVSTEERSTSFSYDGLGRALSQTDDTAYGSATTTSAWSGTNIVQQSNTVSGVTSLVRDALGDLAIQSGDAVDGADARWALLDGLGSTVAQAVGGSVTELGSYSEWGVQSFESLGWDAALNFTGEQSDAGYGLGLYMSRSYDPVSGVWLSQDSWRGLLDQPQTAARYGYVVNSPVSLVDELGYRPAGECDGPCPSSYGKQCTSAIFGCKPAPTCGVVPLKRCPTPALAPHIGIEFQPSADYCKKVPSLCSTSKPSTAKPSSPAKPSVKNPVDNKQNLAPRHDIDIDWALIANILGTIGVGASILSIALVFLRL